MEDKASVGLLILAIFAIGGGATVGLCLHYFLPKPEVVPPVPGRSNAIGDCMPQGEATEAECQRRECIWRNKTDGSPLCHFPEDGYGYLMEGDPQNTTLGYRFNLKRIQRPTLFGNDLDNIVLDLEFHTDYRFRVKFADAAGTRYQVPTAAVNIDIPSSSPPEESWLYNVTWTNEPQFGVIVTRKSSEAVIFNSSAPGFIFSDQYIQFTTQLPSAHVYGFGEHNHRRFKHDMNWKKWTIFTRDVAPVDEWNLYGAQPMYMNLENDGNANAAFLLNSNAMDVVLQPDPHPGLTFHVIGGILDFFIFLGPSPENIVQQYTEATGRPIMPPYWSLGFQLCRWDYDNLTHVRTVVDRNIAAGIPYDVQYGDIDYMESKLDFTYDKVKYDGLPNFVDELHGKGMKYIIILDHCIGSDTTSHLEKLNSTYDAYQKGLAADIFIKDGRNTSMNLEGEVWPGISVYPDFTNGADVTDWWTEQCQDFYSDSRWRVEYDALWIDMNEPSNFVPGSTTGCDTNKWNYPPYVPNILGGWDKHLFDKTICMDAVQAWGKHYDVHSLYGHSMSIVSWDALRTMFPEKRPLVLTRSQFAGSQKYAGHWLGDNQSRWEQIPWSIIGMLEYSLFGFTYTGSDICGFWYATNEEMCQRWMQLGAFYPFARNHNGIGWPDQDPGAFSPEMQRVSRDVLQTRYKLLPFLYTLMHQAHIYGSTVVRPLMHEFTTDQQTWNIDTQFLWGPSFMISPAMAQGQTEVEIYFPKARWYNYYGGEELQSTGVKTTIPTPLDKINLHLRGGFITPWQEPANTTYYSRMLPMGIIVALDENSQAIGSLFWDDGESFETFMNGSYLQVNFTCASNKLDFVVDHNGYPVAENLNFDTIEVFGLSMRPNRVTADSIVLPDNQINFDSSTKVLTVTSVGLKITENHSIEWRTI